MTERDVKIVVAEGASGRKGLLRFVLESEGYRVVGEASTSAELAQALETQHPDVVVMDDGIGATAVGMTHDLAPAAKVILVWPEAVVPIGGDAAVEPSSVLRQLGPTVERLTGAPSVTGRMGAREGAEAAGIGMLSLGAILAMGRAAASPSEPPVPLAASVASDPAEPVIDDRGATPMLILPPTADVGPDGADLPAAAAIAGPLTVAELEAAERRAAVPVPAVGAAAGMAAVAAGAATAGTGTAGVASGAALNRRLGTLALGGAALAGSLVLALALSGSRVPAGGVRGEAPTVSSPPPVTSSPSIPPPRTVAIPGALLGDLGGSGTTLALVSTDVTRGSGARTGAGGGGPTGGTGGNSGETPTTPPTGAGGSGGGSGSVGSGGGGGGSGGSGDPGGSGGGGSDGGSNGGGSFFGGGGGGGKNGGGECEPIAHDGDGRTSEPCVTDDDGLDGTHHGHDDSDHDGDGYQGDGDHQADHDGDGCDGHDDSSDHGHDGDDGDHQHDHGDEHDGDHGGDGYGS